MKMRNLELNLKLVDVGEQRGDQRRWIHCFEGVDAGNELSVLFEF